MSTLFKATLLFSACFCAVALTLSYEFIAGGISPRGLGVGLGCLFVASMLVIAFFLKSRSVREAITRRQDIGTGSWRGKPLAIWVGKAAVVVLLVVFLKGLWHIREQPLIPRLVGLGTNLLVTSAVIIAVRKLQRGSQ
jgi:hypothetical protein